MITDDNTIDLRSDTVTRPDDGMRKAMAEAEVGDDVFQDDPTIMKLEAKVARILGKEAALYCPSGTMANQVAINVQTNPGDEIFCEENAHLLYYEGGAPAFLSHVIVHPIKGHNGAISAEQVRALLRPVDVHFATPKLVCAENTANRAGGRIFPLESLKLLFECCRQKGLLMHLDGARLWNASVATGIPLKIWAQYSDTVNVCLSKGLGAPIGSLMVGTSEIVEKGRRVRKKFGGGMRQVGILGAAGLYAIEHNFQRLVEDHANAKLLAEGLAAIKGIDIDPATVETNIVVFNISTDVEMNAMEFLEVLKHYNVLMVPMGERSVRAVTHLDVSTENVRKTIEVVGSLMAGRF